MSLIGRLCRTAFVALPGLGLASATYQILGEARDRRRYPPPGELVNIGGRRLHLWRAGASAPAVIIVAALGAPGLEWRTVQQELAHDASVYVYDRAGLGWSDPGPWPRTAERMADELHQLLVAAAVSPPYLLVGHSVGGIIARQFAARHPGLLAGMVLVDSSHENQIQRLDPFRDGGGRLTLWRRAARRRLTLLGIVRAATDLGITPQARRDAERESPRGMADIGLALSRTSAHRRAVVQELIGFASSTAGGAPPYLGELPLTVLTAGSAGREHWYPAWREMQNELAALSGRSTHLIAEYAGHHIHLDDPTFVVHAVREAIQSGSSPTAGSVRSR